MVNVFEKLFENYDELEIAQKKTGKFVPEFDFEFGADDHRIDLEQGAFLKGRDIAILKHRRFAAYPKHTHNFLEFNYIYSGRSRQIINGDEVVLEAGQLLILDADSEQTLLAHGERDLVVNFLFKKADLNLDILKKVDTTHMGITMGFVLKALLGKQHYNGYLVIDIRDHREIQMTLEQLTSEYLYDEMYSPEILQAFVRVLFLQLSRVYQPDARHLSSEDHVNLIVDILETIEKNYTNITLTHLAEEFLYNPNYLSNLIKRTTGRTFKELVTIQKLANAHSLLLNTDLSVDDILGEVNYSNKTYFYKKFFERYNLTPKELRKLR